MCMVILVGLIYNYRFNNLVNIRAIATGSGNIQNFKDEECLYSKCMKYIVSLSMDSYFIHCFHSLRFVQSNMQLVSDTTGRDRMCWKKGEILSPLVSDDTSPAAGGGSVDGVSSLPSIALRPCARQDRAGEWLTWAFTRSSNASTASVNHVFISVKSWCSC